MSDDFEYIRETRFDRGDNVGVRPANCPDCGSRAVGTLAKIITPDTYWRCAACGMVWTQKQRR
jgi:DNA-directed RNA polymerase subunit RPC12/RpoP